MPSFSGQNKIIDIIIEFSSQTIVRRNILLCNIKMLLSSYKNIRRIAIVDVGAMRCSIVCNTEIVEKRDAGTQCFYGLEADSAAALQARQIIDCTLKNI